MMSAREAPVDKKKPTKTAGKKAVFPPRKKILLVDDHPMMRAAFAQLINKQPDMEVCSEAGSPVEAFDKLARSKADLALADITMPGRSGIEFIKDLLALYPKLPILVVSMHDEMIYAERVVR